MRTIPVFVLLALLCAFGIAGAQQTDKEDGHACGFVLTEKGGPPSVKGPEDLVPLVYVVSQPDSPIEITGIDLTGSHFSAMKEEYSWSPCAVYEIRNRSNRTIYGFEIMQTLNRPEGGGFGAKGTSSLLAGQAREIKMCGGGSHGRGPGEPPKLVVFVSYVKFEGCTYKPSLRIPRDVH